MLERDIYLEFIGENKLNMGNKKWGGCKEIDVSDREYQMAHLVSFALPGGYVLKNTEDGIDIGGFRFDDSFDEMRPLWNADVIPCKRHNYRLIYQYLTTSADEDSGKE